jgi:signal transduction histidine kinase/ActR/RegA family two-component response regulator
MYHQKAVIGTELYDNFYYVPPEKFLSEDPDDAIFDICVSNLRERKKIDSRIHEYTSELEKTNEALRREIAQRKAIAHEKEIAEIASSQKSEFIAQMSHELRTPLNCIIGALDLLSNTNVSAGQLEYLEMVQSASRHLVTVLSDVLDMSRIESGKLQLERKPESIHKCIDVVLKIFTQTSKIPIRAYIAPDVPSVVIADHTRVRQVLINLVANGCKFTPDGGSIDIRVTTEDFPQPGVIELKFAVLDTGIGIPPEKQITIFDPFTQADSSSSRKYDGVGLGLTICKKLVEAMGGNIHVESTVGKGSVFWFTIKVPYLENGSTDLPNFTPFVERQLKLENNTKKKNDVSFTSQHFQEKRVDIPKNNDVLQVNNDTNNSNNNHANTNNNKSENNGDDKKLKQLNVLIAEDNPMNRLILKHMFTKIGVSFTLVENGQEAVSAVKTADYDFVFLDLHMPVLDGFTAAQLIRSYTVTRLKRPKLIAITASIVEEDKRRCTELGFTMYIIKPVKIETLQNALLEHSK